MHPHNSLGRRQRVTRLVALSSLVLVGQLFTFTPAVYAQPAPPAAPTEPTEAAPAPAPAPAPASATAESGKEICLSSYVSAQTLAKEGKLKASAAEYLKCQKPECGALIADECTRMYETTVAQTPSVVVAVYGENKAELHEAKVFLDEVLVQERLEGAPITVDPGVHHFRFEAPGLPVKSLDVTVRSGDKNRLIEVPLVEPPAPPVAAVPVAPVPVGPPPAKPIKIPLPAYVLGGVGLVGLGVGTALMIKGGNDYSALESGCGRTGLCKVSEVDSVRGNYKFAYVGFAVGAAAAIAAATLVIVVNTSPSKESKSPQLALMPSPAGASASMSWRF